MAASVPEAYAELFQSSAQSPNCQISARGIISHNFSAPARHPWQKQEYERKKIQEHLAMAARKPVPAPNNKTLMSGDMVYVYRERSRKCTGPHMAASASGKPVRLHIGDKRGSRESNLSQIREDSLGNAYSNGLWETPYGLMVLHTEGIPECDPRNSLFDYLKRKELLDIFERGAFRT